MAPIRSVGSPVMRNTASETAGRLPVRASRVGAPGTSKWNKVAHRLFSKGRRVSDRQLADVNIEPNAFHGEWNYTIRPIRPTAA